MILILACICIAAAAALAGLSLAGFGSVGQRVGPLSKLVGTVNEPPAAGDASEAVPTTNLHDAILARSRTERVVRPGVQRAQELLRRVTPEGRVEALYRHAITAGEQRNWTPGRIRIWNATGIVLGVLSGIALWGALSGLMRLVVTPVAALVGFYALELVLRGRATARRDAVLNALPDVIDQISISVQAGLGFDAAIQRITTSVEGPLAEEFGRLLHDLRIGSARATAFTAMAERADVDELSSFVRAIIQAERSGVTIVHVLTIQADEQRDRRRQRAEERAMKLPVLMVMPLVLCILPPLFIVLMGPAILRFF